MTTFNGFLASNHVKFKAAHADHNPNMADSENMDHWRVVFKLNRRTLTTYFSMGYGHNGKEPVAGDVIGCLVSDARGADYCRSFEDWCGDYGYDPDSRKAERIFKACERTSKELKRFFADKFDDLLQCDED